MKTKDYASYYQVLFIDYSLVVVGFNPARQLPDTWKQLTVKSIPDTRYDIICQHTAVQNTIVGFFVTVVLVFVLVDFLLVVVVVLVLAVLVVLVLVGVAGGGAGGGSYCA